MKNSIRMTTITLQVPEGFNALTIARKYRRRMRDQQLLADRLNWFMHLLVELPLRQDIRKKLETRGYIPLQHKKFLHLYKSDSVTDEITRILVKKEKVVERDQSYRTGHYSKGYRLNGALLTGRTYSVRVLTKEMRDSLQEFWKKRKVQQKKMVRSFNFLTEFIEDPDLTVDLEGAHHFVEHWASELQKMILSQSADNGEVLTVELINRAHTKMYYAKESLRRINNPDKGTYRYWNRDSKGHRLHSSFTGLKKPLRHFLKYKGQDLVSIDIKASQPYLFTRLLQSDFWGKKSESINLRSIHPDLHQKLSEDDTLSSLIISTANAVIDSGPGVCGYAYKSIPWNQDFYSLLMEQIRCDFYEDKKVFNCYSQRGLTKYHNMLLFFEPRVRHVPYTNPFSKYFPGVYSIMNKIRKTPGLLYTNGEKEKTKGTIKNNNLPIILQRLEAELLLQKICKEIHEQNPAAFLLTIHDSILTTVEHAETVKSCMIRIFTEQIGTAPGLTEELLDKDFVMDSFDEFIDQEWIELMDKVKKGKKKGSGFSSSHLQQLLDHYKRMAADPLILNVLPQLKDGRKILSTKYVSDYTEDLQRD